MGQQKLKMVKNKAFIFIISNCLIIGCKSTKVENVIIPQSYTGNVAIIYGNEEGTPTNVQTYPIGEDGIFRTPYQYISGSVRINFLQQRNKREYDTLAEELPGEILDTSKNRIYFNRILTFYQKNGKEKYVMTFYIGKKNASDLVKDRFLFENHLEKIVLNE